jgi:hypothetical protein
MSTDEQTATPATIMVNDDQGQGDQDGGSDGGQESQETDDSFEFDDEQFTRGLPPKRVERK